MSPKSIALLVVGMVLISSVFFIFHVSYPSNPATIKFNHVPKNIKPPTYQIFQNQTFNQPGLGFNQTSFTPTGNTTVTLQGYVFNASTPANKKPQPIADQVLGVAVMQALTLVRTNASGFYHIKILASGQGVFAFKVFQYNTAYETVYIGHGSTIPDQNVSLTPQTKYSVSGLTQSLGKPIPGVSLTFINFWGNYYDSSSSSGSYTVNMVNGPYEIKAVKSGFESIPDPSTVNVFNTSISKYNLNLNSTNSSAFYMNGYIFNKIGDRISNADVFDSAPVVANGSNLSTATGFYNISVAFGKNYINIDAEGYTPYTQIVPIYHNTTNENFTLDALDPFSSSTGQTGITNGEPRGLGNQISKVNYGNPSYITISGQVISTQTGMPVPNTGFTLYTSVNGTYFDDIIATNSTGYYKVNVLFTGDYHVNVTSVQFYDTWLNESSLAKSIGGQNIYVTTSPNQVYHLSGGVINGINNSSLTNATITVYSNNGGVLTTVQTNATGQFNISLLGGTYNISISKPGFGTSNTTVTVAGNQTLPPTPISPTTSISPGSSQWTTPSGSGLPGVNGTSISNQLNSTQNSTGISPGTNSSTPVSMLVRMMNNVTKTSSINNTSYEMFIRVNGITLKVAGFTDASGYSYLNLSYGGSYILLPEMVDYSGIATLVNTSQYQGTGQVLDLYLNPLPVYNLTLNLSNPLSGYYNANVPSNGLNVTGLSLPVSYNSTIPGSNYTVFNYVLPNGKYDFTYSDAHYVTLNFTASLNGAGKIQTEKLIPYVLKLSWNTNASWAYDLSGPGISVAKGVGALGISSNYTALAQGSYSFSAYLGSNLVNSTTFTIHSSAPNASLSFNAKYNSEVLKNVPVNVSFPALVLKLKANLTSTQSKLTEYISNVAINLNVPSNATLLFGNSGTVYHPTSNVFNISNYFVLGSSGQTTLSITADISSSELTQVASGVNLTITYYTTSLTG